jgi:hypothetical protein
MFLVPPRYTKLGLINYFVNALEKSGKSFLYLRSKFPNLSDAEVREGIFVSPQIRKLMFVENFEKNLNSNILATWASFKAMFRGFLGNMKDENYTEIIQSVLQNYQKLGCRM